MGLRICPTTERECLTFTLSENMIAEGTISMGNVVLPVGDTPSQKRAVNDRHDKLQTAAFDMCSDRDCGIAAVGAALALRNAARDNNLNG